MRKEEYEAPSVERIGSFEEVTLGNSDGITTDQAFPTDTPKPDLTFS